ncbi:hemagglutinin/amebocyte aggregation factor-like isoform X1 [Lissotriton helveticus]
MKALILLASIIATIFAEGKNFQDAPTESGEILSPRWVNEYDKQLIFTCPVQESIDTVISDHHGMHKDRVWDFTCKKTFSATPSCQWSPYVNEFDKELTYSCPFGSAVSGFDSYHENWYEDRRWKIYCCSENSNIDHDCQWTDYVNDFAAYMRWQVPTGRYIVGVSSYHENHKEDRRWKYQHCAIRA